jgi:hypothetical protein
MERPGCECGRAFFVSISVVAGSGKLSAQGEAERAESDGTLLVVALRELERGWGDVSEEPS